MRIIRLHRYRRRHHFRGNRPLTSSAFTQPGRNQPYARRRYLPQNAFKLGGKQTYSGGGGNTDLRRVNSPPKPLPALAHLLLSHTAPPPAIPHRQPAPPSRLALARAFPPGDVRGPMTGRGRRHSPERGALPPLPPPARRRSRPFSALPPVPLRLVPCPPPWLAPGGCWRRPPCSVRRGGGRGCRGL